MKSKILYVERQPSAAVSIEKVFRQIAKNISDGKFTIDFQQLQYPNNTLGTLKNLLFFRRAEADIYHVTGHVHYITLVLPKNRTVLTVHDAGILNIRSGLRRYVLKKLLFDLPVKRIKFITAVSEATKADIIRYTNCDEKKIRVIENPLFAHFYAARAKDFNSQSPVILQIGTTANKNLYKLIQALEGVECRLRIIGALGDEITNLLKEKRIIYENELSLNDEQIREEYENADIVTFCSTFEGFGLPIIEAQAMRKPVVTSNLSPMREVAGKGAALVSPDDFESIRTAILRVIKDEHYRKKIVEDGLENVKRFEPETIAGLYESLYQEVLSENL